MTKHILSPLAILLFASLLPVQAQADWQVNKTFSIGGQGGWDYLTVDPQTHRLYVPRSTHTMVIDSESGKTIADIPGQKIAHGVALVPEAGRGFITDGGGSGAILIFDLKTNAILGSIVAQPDADGIIFDSGSGCVVVVSGDKGVLMTIKPDIDPKSGKIDPVVDLGGAPEFLASDGAGKVYVNLMDKNEVAVVDLKARKVVARWPVAPGGAPVGMTIDPTKGHLLIGCRKPQKLIIMSTRNGKVLAALPIGDHVDAVKIDNGHIFASCGDGTLAVVRETSPGKFEVVQTVKTPPGARTMGADPTTHRIYLPTAESEPGAGGRTKMKPGTFMIVVVSRDAAS
jgi:hypothetical protein